MLSLQADTFFLECDDDDDDVDDDVDDDDNDDVDDDDGDDEYKLKKKPFIRVFNLWRDSDYVKRYYSLLTTKTKLRIKITTDKHIH